MTAGPASAAHAAVSNVPAFVIALQPSNTGHGTGNPSEQLDVNGASTAVNAHVVEYWPNDNANQAWAFLPDGSDYKIENLVSSDCLTTDGIMGHPVYQAPCNESGQDWSTGIFPGDEYPYYIQSASSGLYLDVQGEGPSPGTTIDTWTFNSGAWQAFYGVPLPSLNQANTSFTAQIATGNGYYLTDSYGLPDDTVRVGGGGNATLFEFISVDNDFDYEILDADTSTCITTSGITGTSPAMQTCQGTPNQIWRTILNPSDGQSEYIVSAYGGPDGELNLDVRGGCDSCGILDVWPSNGGGSNQKFWLSQAS